MEWSPLRYLEYTPKWANWIVNPDKEPPYIRTPSEEPEKPVTTYQRKIRGTIADVYDVLLAWNVTCPATQHAIKKLLCPGVRGHKGYTQDLQEALHAIYRAIELAPTEGDKQ